MSNIKEIDTDQGQIILPVSIQSSETPSGKMKNQEERLFELCFYLKKNYMIRKRDCLKLLENVPVEDIAKAKFDLTVEGHKNFAEEILNIFADRHTELVKGGDSEGQSTKDAATLSEELGKAIQADAEEVTEEKLIEAVDAKIESVTAALKPIVEEIVKEEIASPEILKAEDRIDAEIALAGVAKSPEFYKESLEKIEPALISAGEQQLATTSLEIQAEVSREIDDKTKSDMLQSVKDSFGGQEALILAEVKKERKVTGESESLQLESEITNLINTHIESVFNAKLESMKASLIKTEVESSLTQELSLEMDKQLNIVSEIDAQM
jgi:hypothetical protein